MPIRKYYLLILVAVALCFAPRAHGAITFVQSSSVWFGNLTTSTIYLPNVGAGNFLIIAESSYYGFTGSYIKSCSDNASDTFYAPSRLDPGAGQVGSMCYAANVVGGNTTTTVTVASNPGTPTSTYFVDLVISEFSGVASGDPIDVSSKVTANSSSSAADNISSNASTTTAADLIFGEAVCKTAYTGSVTAGTGQTLIANMTSTQLGGITVEYMVQTVAGLASSTFTTATSGKSFIGIMGAFKPASGAAPPPIKYWLNGLIQLIGNFIFR